MQGKATKNSETKNRFENSLNSNKMYTGTSVYRKVCSATALFIYLFELQRAFKYSYRRTISRNYLNCINSYCNT